MTTNSTVRPAFRYAASSSRDCSMGICGSASPWMSKSDGTSAFTCATGLGKSCERGLFVRLSPEQKLQRRHAHAQAVRRGLAEDRLQIRRAEETHDRLHVGTLIHVRAQFAFQFRVAVGSGRERREMPARRTSGDSEALWIESVFRRTCAQKADCRLDVVHLRGEWRDRRKPVVHTRHGEPCATSPPSGMSFLDPARHAPPCTQTMSGCGPGFRGRWMSSR